MRIKKPITQEKINKTFANIALRDAAKETLSDGDIIKVLDASDDPEISSGWAIYRFAKEGGTFDLVEQEIEAVVKSLIPDYKTSSLGVNAEGEEVLVVPELMRVYAEGVQFPKDFDLAVNLSVSGFYNKITVTPEGMTDGVLQVPVKTSDGLLYMNLKTAYNLTYRITDGITHALYSAYLVGSPEDSTATYYVEYDKDNGYCQQKNTEVAPVAGGAIPLMIVKFKTPVNGVFNPDDLHIFKFWKSRVKEETAVESVSPDYITTTDGVDPEKDTITTPMLFSAIDKSLEILQDFDYDISVDAFKRLIFSVQGLEAPNASVSIPVNTVEGRKYIRLGMGMLSVHFEMQANYMHWHLSTQIVDEDDPTQPQIVSIETPADGKCIVLNDERNGVDNNGFFPLMIVRCEKDVNGDWDAQKLSVFKLWKNNLALNSSPEIKIDSKTIVENPSNELVSFHDLNQGLGFEFPEPTALNVDFSDPAFMKIHWLNHKTGVDVFKYKNIEYKLGLRDHTYSAAGVQTNCDTLGFTHYARISAHLGYIYWGARCELFSELPDTSPFIYSSKEYLPVAIVKLVFNPDYTLNLVETQISEIYKKGALIKEASEVQTPSKTIFPDGYTIDEYDLNNGERPTFAVIDAMKSFRNDQVLLEDFDYEVSYIGNTDSFFFTPSKEGKVPILINGVKKYLVLAQGGFKRNLLPVDCNTAYLTVTGTIVDTIGEFHNTIGCGYSGTGCHQIRPHSDDFNSNVILFQARVTVPPLGGEIDKQSIYMSKYWRRALNIGAIPTFDANTIDRSQVSEYSNQFSVPEAMHGFRQNQIILKDFDFDFSHDKDTKLITMSVRGGGFKAIPILVDGVRKYIHIQESTFDMSNFGFGFNRFHFAVSAPIRDTNVYSTNGMTNQYNGENGSITNVMPSKFDSVTLFQVSGTMPTFGTELEAHAFSIHKYWKKALAPFHDLYAEMMA